MKAKEYMNFPKPSLSVVKTVGGFFRVEVHGVDSLQDGQTYAVMDIGRGPTKEAALEDAMQWFAGIQDRTPQDKQRE